VKAKPTAKLARKPAPKAIAKKKATAPKVQQAKAQKLQAKARPAQRRAPLQAKPPTRAAKPPARAARSLILPPKPKRLAARLLLARPPRPPVVLELRPEAAPTSPKPVLVAAPANASILAPKSALRMRERAPRARVTLDTWRKLEESGARLGRAPLTDEQRVAIRAALEGHDSLVVMPDDERAMSCYQLAALQLEQPTVVLSPLLAELKAQHAAFSERKLAVVCVPPEQAGPERSAALARISRGGSLLVLLTPEGLRSADVQQALAKSGIALFVVEEAHCASDASHELRPSYAELGQTLRGFGSPPLMALARVATSAVRKDISERLGLSAPVTVHSAPVRENLQLVTKLARGEGRQASLVRLVERLELPGLVFCATPHDVDSVYAALRGAGIAAHRHHSGMTPGDRAGELLNFTLPGQRSVMVALSAFAPSSGLPGIGGQAEGFGRGPGKRDLRFVVHYQSPASIEQYLREIQRAGVDGKPALCVLLHESSHRSLHEVMLAQQRFKATHLAELGRALETPALEGRTVTLEALALGTGQSRRTTDRLTALLADAGVVARTGGWVRVLCSASELDEACRRLGAQLYALRERDARRLASVSAFAEANECKLSCLDQYLGDGAAEPCARCNGCVHDLLAPSQESLAPQAPTRRAVVQEFSVQAVAHPYSGVVPSGAGSLTAKLADFGTGSTTQK
jgi:ATP-dependent DNA helicase RecQ